MRRISKETWEQIKTAYAAGIGLRELARNMEIPAGTVLARAKREGWTQQIAAAKLIERPHLAREIAKPHAINAITPDAISSGGDATTWRVLPRAHRWCQREGCGTLGDDGAG